MLDFGSLVFGDYGFAGRRFRSLDIGFGMG
jgi:hypothetical protein